MPGSKLSAVPTSSGNAATGDRLYLARAGVEYYIDPYVYLLDRGKHYGTQLASTISDFNTQVGTTADMLKSVYDPTAIGASAFSMDNMVETATKLVLTDTERSKLAAIADNANNYSHPNHTGDVVSTGDGATTIQSTAITGKTLDTPVDADFVLFSKTSEGGALKKGSLAAWLGDMEASDYDPTGVVGDAFSMDNMAETATKKILTDTERTKLSTVEQRANHSGTQLLATISDAGTSASLNVPATGDAAAGEVVKGDDTRLTNARAPTAHTHTAAEVNDASANGRSLITAADYAAMRTLLNVADGANNYVHPNHTGDVTSTGGGATVIGAKKVLLSMMADFSAVGKILKGGTGGVVEERDDLISIEVPLTAAGGKITAGDVFVFDYTYAGTVTKFEVKGAVAATTTAAAFKLQKHADWSGTLADQLTANLEVSANEASTTSFSNATVTAGDKGAVKVQTADTGATFGDATAIITYKRD